MNTLSLCTHVHIGPGVHLNPKATVTKLSATVIHNDTRASKIAKVRDIQIESNSRLNASAEGVCMSISF